MGMTKICSVDSNSPAQRAGVKPGDTLTHVNGHPVADVLDYKFYTYDPDLKLSLCSADGNPRILRIKKGPGEDLGLNFETYLMDHAHSCANRCIFCFVDQMPPGMRDTLYFKDDDARLSFLMGNYITMTNLSQREIERIIDLRISPIRISVHTTDPELRVKMLNNPRAGRCMEDMRRLAAARILMDCQIVACPGINDGKVLENTLTDLAALYPSVRSISVVPVGLTRFRKGLYPLKSYTAQEAVQILELVERFSARCFERFKTRLVWCSDEFYLRAGRQLPDEMFYEDFTQLENGVGMLRLLESEFKAALSMIDPAQKPDSFSVATGVSAAPYLSSLLRLAQSHCPALQGTIYPVVNHFFGETINVAGLITGSDLIEQLQGKELGERLLLPASMLRHQERVFLDDKTVEQVEEKLGVPIVTVEQDGGALADAMFYLEDREDGMKSDNSCEKMEAEYYAYRPPRVK